MSKTLNKLKKLKGRSLTEFRVRGAQAIAAAAERYNLSPQARVPSDAALFRSLHRATTASSNDDRKPFGAEQLLEQFRRRASPNFFASFTAHGETLAELRGRFGAGDRALVIERGARICEGKFDLLGLRDLSFGEPVNWHLEPISGKQTPLSHWSRIKYLDAAVAGDKKITWELNRHQYFMTLGRAYWHTGDELFAQTYVAHLGAWMDANPPKMGINWASSLEVAFRAISWLWAIHFFKDAPSLTPEVFQRALKFLFLHARHLETYLSTYFSPNTHLTGEALGLYYLGTLLPEFRAAARWRAAGRSILLAQLERHVRPDGVYFEQSSYYHRYTTDFYTHFYLLAQANGEHVGDLLEEKLQSLLDHLMYITRPDGRTPVFGDDDGGRLVTLDERAANDFRAALSTGAALFGRADYKYVAGGAAAEETLWLLGGAGLRKFDQLAAHPPATLSRAFPDGGYYVMRDGWTPADNYLLIDCGPHGADNCGHAHADALAFELAAGGRIVLVDPGTYTYTGSATLRNEFRGSPAHNTLSIDGESSSVPGGPFTWQHIARAAARRFVANERFDFFAGQHDGYERLPSPATHAREVLFIKGEYWMLRDTVTTAGTHHYQWRYHFAPHAAPSVRAGRRQGFAGFDEGRMATPELEILLPGEEAEVHGEEGWVSECYGARTPSPVVVVSAAGEGPQDFMTFLIPRGKNRAGVVEWREVAATGGRAFAALVKDGRHLVMVGDGRRIEAAPFSSDFAWTWARMGRDESVPEELILIEGGYLSLDGREVIKSGQPIGYLVARHVGDEWLVETDASDMLVFTPPVGDGRVVINGVPDAAGREGQLIGK